MSSACIYGLRLESNQPIPGVPQSTATTHVDLHLWLGTMPSWREILLESAERWYSSAYLDERGEPALTIWKLDFGAYFSLRYSDGTEFLVDRLGTELWASWPKESTLEATAICLLGPVMGIVLLLRGTHSLHASAIAAGEHAIAIVGPSGAGKSSTAAAFARLGYSVLSDDVVALVAERGDFLVQPAYPCLRLWSDSVSALFGAPDALPLHTKDWDKRYLDLTQNGYQFQGEPLPLAAIYVLGERRDEPSAPFVEAVTGNDGLISLVANTYATNLLDKTMRAREFEFLKRLASKIPVRKVTPHHAPAHLLKLCSTILEDFERHVLTALAMTGAKQTSYV